MFDLRPSDETRRPSHPAQIALFEDALFDDCVGRTFVRQRCNRSPKRKRGTQSDRSNLLPHSRFRSRPRETRNFKNLVPSSNTESPWKSKKCRNLSHCVASKHGLPVCRCHTDIIAGIGAPVHSAFLPRDPARGNPRHQSHAKPSDRRQSPDSVAATTSNPGAMLSPRSGVSMLPIRATHQSKNDNRRRTL